MKKVIALFSILGIFALANAKNKNNPQESFKDEPVDCFEFAGAVEGQAGDAGDFETFFEAFEFCANAQGMQTATP